MANIIVFGDSISFGFYDTKGGWVTRLIAHFSNIEPPEKEFHTKIYNMAVPGATSTDVLDQMDTIIKYRSWENEQSIIVFQIGTNDSGLWGQNNKPGTDIATFESNLNNILDKSKKFTGNIIFMGLLNVDETKTIPVSWDNQLTYTNSQISKYDEIIQKVTSLKGVNYLPLINILAGDDLLVDGLHLSPAGHELLFNQMLTTLNKVILNNNLNNSNNG